MTTYNPLKFNASQVELDKLNATFSTIVCIGLPKGWEFGVDYCSWTVGDNFRGLRFVPPGAHYIYCAPTAASTLPSGSPALPIQSSGGLRIGEWIYSRPASLHVFRFDTSSESLIHIADTAELGRFAAGLARGDFERGLARYPLEEWCQWRDLTVLITEYVLDACVATQNPTSNVDAAPSACVSTSSSTPASNSTTTATDPVGKVFQDSSSPDFSTETSACQLLPQPRVRRILPHERRHKEEQVSSVRMRFVPVPDASVLEAQTCSSQDPSTASIPVPEQAGGVCGLVGGDLTQLFFDRTWALGHMLHAAAPKYRTYAGLLRWRHVAGACPLVSIPTVDACVCVRVPGNTFSSVSSFSRMQLDLSHHDLADSISALVARWSTNSPQQQHQQQTSPQPLPSARPLASSSALLTAATAPTPAPLPWNLVVALPCPGLSLLSELQLSFAGLLVGEDYASLLHWRDAVDTLCRCDSALDDPPSPEHAPSGGEGGCAVAYDTPLPLNHSCLFYTAFLTLLARQLHALPPDMFIDAIAADNFLRDALLALKLIVEAALQQHVGVDRRALSRSTATSAVNGAGGDGVDGEISTDAAATALAASTRMWAPLDGHSQWAYLLYAWAAVEALVAERFGLFLGEEEEEELAPMVAGEDGGFM